MTIINNRLLIRRITSVQAIKNRKGEVIAYKAVCNHGPDSAIVTKLYPLNEWGSIAFDLAQDWALNHRCSGDTGLIGSQSKSINLTV